MKRIILFTVLFLVLVITSSIVFAIEDLTPPPDAYVDSPYPQALAYVPADVTQTAAAVSRIESKLVLIEGKMARVFTKEDVTGFINELNTRFEMQIGEVLGKMLALLLVWQTFFFATLFVAKSKGWL